MDRLSDEEIRSAIKCCIKEDTCWSVAAAEGLTELLSCRAHGTPEDVGKLREENEDWRYKLRNAPVIDVDAIIRERDRLREAVRTAVKQFDEDAITVGDGAALSRFGRTIRALAAPEPEKEGR
jgi:hypothetical protein